MRIQAGGDDETQHLRPLCLNIIKKVGGIAQYFQKVLYLCIEISLKYVFVMARPIRETPVLKGEDAFNFEMRRLEVEHMSKEQRAENLKRVEEGYARAKSYINFHW